MARPDVLAYDSTAAWLADWHADWLADPQRLSAEVLAQRAGMSPGHFYNLLAGRRPLLLPWVGPLADALGLPRAEREHLSRLVLGERGTEGLIEPSPHAPPEVLARLREAQRRLRVTTSLDWGVRGSYWTFGPAQAASVFEAGRQGLARAAPHGSGLMRIQLQMFPVSVDLSAMSSGESKVIEEVGLTSLKSTRTVRDMTSVAHAAPDVLDFLDYREFLQEWQTRAGSQHTWKSVGWLAGKVGITSGQLHNVLKGRRNFDAGLLETLSSRLALDEVRARYLLLLTRFNDLRQVEPMAMAWDELNRIRARNGRPLETGVGSPLWSRWFLPAALELSRHPSWRAEPSWLATALAPAMRAADADDALHVLRAAGHLGAPPREERQPATVHTACWEPSVIVSRFYEECLDVAAHHAGGSGWAEHVIDLPVPEALTPQALVQSWGDALVPAAEAIEPSHDGSHSVYLFLAQAWRVTGPPAP